MRCRVPLLACETVPIPPLRAPLLACPEATVRHWTSAISHARTKQMTILIALRGLRPATQGLK